MSEIHRNIGLEWVNYESQMDNMVELLRQKDPKFFHPLGMGMKYPFKATKHTQLMSR